MSVLFPSRKAALVLTLVLVGPLLLTGCKESAQPATGEVSNESASSAPEPQIWPLTGEPAAAGQQVALPRPVLVVKIDNTDSAAPQEGLGSADMVVEELVEGGATRLAAFYYSKLPNLAGPVRSMRASDIGIVSSVNASIITSGAAGVTIGRIRGADIPFFEEGAKGFFRDSGRYAPYNLMDRPKETATLAKIKPTVPPSYFSFGDPADLPAGQKAGSFDAFFGGMQTTSWVWANGHWINKTSLANPDDEFDPTSIVALKVPVEDAGYTDPAGNYVPESKFVGSGEATLFYQGRAIRGTWSKKALDSRVSLKTKDGELLVPPGRIWVELIPNDGGSLTIRKK